MPYRLTKIYTRQGDDGFTRLKNKKISKDDFLVEVVGTLDELNAFIGNVISITNRLMGNTENEKIENVLISLKHIQNDLFNFGGELHQPDFHVIKEEKVKYLENILDQLNADLPPLEDFLLPGGNEASAACHIARTVSRRAERRLVALHSHEPLNNVVMIKYLNRLSDLLFVMARTLGRLADEREEIWEKGE